MTELDSLIGDATYDVHNGHFTDRPKIAHPETRKNRRSRRLPTEVPKIRRCLRRKNRMLHWTERKMYREVQTSMRKVS